MHSNKSLTTNNGLQNLLDTRLVHVITPVFASYPVVSIIKNTEVEII